MPRLSKVIFAAAAVATSGKMLKGSDDPLEALALQKEAAAQAAESQKSSAHDADMLKNKADAEAAAAAAKLKAAEDLVKAAKEAAARAKAAEEEAGRIAAENAKKAELMKKEALASIQREETELTKQLLEATQKAKAADEEFAAKSEAAKQANMRKAASIQMAKAAEQKAADLTEVAKKAAAVASAAEQKKATTLAAQKAAEARTAAVIAADEERIRNGDESDGMVEKHMPLTVQTGAAAGTNASAAARYPTNATNASMAEKNNPTALYVLASEEIFHDPTNKSTLEDLANVKSKAIDLSNDRKDAAKASEAKRMQADKEAAAAVQKLHTAEEMEKAAATAAQKAKVADADATKVAMENAAASAAAKQEVVNAMQHERDQLAKEQGEAKAAAEAADEESNNANKAAQAANLRKVAAIQMATAAVEKAKAISAASDNADHVAQEANQRQIAANAAMAAAKKRFDEAHAANIIKAQEVNADISQVSAAAQSAGAAEAAPPPTGSSSDAGVSEHPPTSLWRGNAMPTGVDVAKLTDGAPELNVQVLGLQNSGVDLLNALLRLNFGNRLNYFNAVPDDATKNARRGLWRHANLKAIWTREPETIKKLQESDVRLLMVVRNPMSWLQSMRDEPSGMSECVEGENWLTKPCVHQHPAGPDSKIDPISFTNVEYVWNNWVKSYKTAKEFGFEKKFVVKYETLLREPETVMGSIGKFLGFQAPTDGWSALPAESDADRQGAIQYIDDRRYLSQYNDAERSEVCKQLDAELQQTFEYTDCE